jgi:glycerol kinase
MLVEAGDSASLAASLDGNDGVYFVPALAGLGSPWWDADARGLITGLTRGSTRAHLARAALEAIAYQVRDVVEAIPGGVIALRADGGAAANGWLMQFQADVLGAPVVVPEIAETTALGAAYLAGIATGRWTREQVGEMWREARRYEPRMGIDERETLLAEWRRALERSRNWVRPSA